MNPVNQIMPLIAKSVTATAEALRSLQPSMQEVLEMRQRRKQAIQRVQNLRKSFVFVYWNLDELRPEDFFSLADMLQDENPTQNIDFIVLSPGGNGSYGYRIGHTLQQWAMRRELSFRVIVPLYAKSAATILALGAHEIHMGVQSEIGPIDPQFPKYDPGRGRWRYIPALALFDGVKLVSEHLKAIPTMGQILERIIERENLTLDDLGLLERARKSGKQYGEVLLEGGMVPERKKARDIAEHLTDFYKFHGHPIDAFEVERLGLKMVLCEPEEWQAIKDVRDEYQKFVGNPSLIPGAMVTTAIETVKSRVWRYEPLEDRGEKRRYDPGTFNL